MTENWIALEITVPVELADPVSNFCHERGSSGIVLEEQARSSTLLRAYFPGQTWESVHAELRRYLSDLGRMFPDLPQAALRVVPVKAEDWATKWKDHFKPIHVGKRLVVSPPWIRPHAQGREIVLVEPAEAFGTGTHETTQGCLSLLEDAIDELEGTPEIITMLDLGCGSGILAIAGAKLGIKAVLAVDNDPVAIEAARKNAELNQVDKIVEPGCLSLSQIEGAWSIVTANLDPKTLLENSERLASLFTKFLIISGVPLEQWEDVKTEFQHSGTNLRKEITKHEWGCGLFVKRTS